MLFFFFFLVIHALMATCFLARLPTPKAPTHPIHHYLPQSRL